MADGTPAIFGGIADRLRYLSERQRVIAQNIANSETPGFKAHDVEAPDFSALISAQGGAGPARIARPRVAPTAAMQALGVAPGAVAGTVLDRDISETKPDGNNVTLEDQLLKMGQAQADFAALTNLYRKQQSLLKIALGRGGGG